MFLARIVMPRSRSRSLVSRICSPTSCVSRNRPLWRNMQSTRLVLPWSTWAIMATLRMSVRRIGTKTLGERPFQGSETIQHTTAGATVQPRPQTGVLQLRVSSFPCSAWERPLRTLPRPSHHATGPEAALCLLRLLSPLRPPRPLVKKDAQRQRNLSRFSALSPPRSRLPPSFRDPIRLQNFL